MFESILYTISCLYTSNLLNFRPAPKPKKWNAVGGMWSARGANPTKYESGSPQSLSRSVDLTSESGSVRSDSVRANPLALTPGQSRFAASRLASCELASKNSSKSFSNGWKVNGERIQLPSLDLERVKSQSDSIGDMDDDVCNVDSESCRALTISCFLIV